MRIVSDFKDFYDWMFYKGCVLHDPYYTYVRKSSCEAVDKDRDYLHVYGDDIGVFIKIGETVITDIVRYSTIGMHFERGAYKTHEPAFDENAPGVVRDENKFFSYTDTVEWGIPDPDDYNYIRRTIPKRRVLKGHEVFKGIDDAPVMLIVDRRYDFRLIIRNPKLAGFRHLIPLSDLQVGQAILQWFADRDIPPVVEQDNKSKITSHGFDLKTSFRGKS